MHMPWTFELLKQYRVYMFCLETNNHLMMCMITIGDGSRTPRRDTYVGFCLYEED